MPKPPEWAKLKLRVSLIALLNGGEHRETNLQPLCRSAHKEKTREDVRTKAKIARVRAKHLNLHRPKQIMAGSKASIPSLRW
ncbi:HNH endonuclease [Cereibacter changlensis]|uniref:HNH endonuclease n=1 Tax=Cereibacter changlensis TaxID=402884 RepID=A0A4U0YW10_9RHOB|nr:HNH endonuclease [Cereibacter changlensis]